MSDMIRMGGLVSGTDVRGIIDQLLTLRTKRIDTVQEQKVSLEEDIAAWMTVNSYMSTLTESLDKLRTFDIWRTMAATSSDSSTLSATASGNAVQSSYTIEIIQRAAAHSIASDRVDDTSANLVGDVLEGGETFTINGQEITIDNTNETLITLAAKINEAAISMDENDKVFAQIIDNYLVITRSKTGAADIRMEDTGGGEALEKLGILDGASYKHEWVAAADSKFRVNGSEVITRSSNTGISDVIPGVSLNLLADSGTATLTIAPDISETKAAIMDFVTNYNETISKIREYTHIDLSNPKNPAVGRLQGDTLARAIPTDLRRLATARKSSMTEENASYTYAGRTGVLNSLQGIGIWTGGSSAGSDGTGNALDVIDEDRLDYMLSNYYDLVEQMFRGVSGSDEKGVARDLYDYAYKLSDTMVGDIDVKIQRLADQATDKTTQMNKMFDELDRYETRLWYEFTAMENAIAKMQQDLSWLVSQTGIGD